MEVEIQFQSHLSAVTRIEQFYAELQEIQLSPEFSEAELMVYLNQAIDEMFFMTFFQGTADDYAFLFAVTPVFMKQNQTFAREVHDIHFSSLANHAEPYLKAFEAAAEPHKLAAIEALEMEVVGYYEIPLFVEPFMESGEHPAVNQHFRSFFEQAHAELNS